MRTDQKHHAVASLLAATVFAAVAIMIVELIGGWPLAVKSGLFGGLVTIGTSAMVSCGTYLLTRAFLANRTVNRPSDPIAEAKVYAAYGREVKAVKILDEALKRDPQNSEIPAILQALREK